MTDYNVRIKVTADGAKAAGDQIEGIGKQAKSTNTAIDQLKSALTKLAAAYSIGKLIEYADGYATLQARLKGVSKDAAEYAAVQSRLTSIANDSRSGVQETANLYAKLKIGTQGLSFSTDDLLKVTGSLNKTFALSGATAEETKNALIQLNQGLGAGALRGEEFNSVQEATQGEFGRIIEKAGLVSGSIRQLADNGQLTADLIIKSFQKMGAEIDTRFGQIPLTVGQAFTVLNNSIFNFIGAANQGTGVTALLAQGILFIASNLQTLVGILITAGVSLGTFYAASLGATTATNGLRLALVGIQAILAINPFVLIATAIAGIVTALYTLAPQMSLFGSQTMTVGGAINSTFAIMRDLLLLIGQIALDVGGYFADKWGQLVDLLGRATASISGFFSAITTNADGTRTIIGSLVDAFNALWGAVVKALGPVASFLAARYPAFSKVVDDIKSFGQTTAAATPKADEFGKSLGKTAGAAGAAASSIKSVGSAIDYTADKITMQQQAVNAMIERYQALSKAANDNADAVSSSASRASGALASAGESASSGGGTFSPFTNNSGANGKGIPASISSGGASAGLDVNQYATQLDFFRAAGATTGFGNSALGQAQSTLYQVLKDVAYFNAPKRGGGYRDPNEALANAQQGIARVKAMLGGYDAATVKSALGSLSSLVGFRTGGSFRVGGQDGVDKNLVMFRATKGEQVSVETPAQQRRGQGGGSAIPPVVNIQISTPDADSFRRSQTQSLTDFARQLQRAMSNA